MVTKSVISVEHREFIVKTPYNSIIHQNTGIVAFSLWNITLPLN